MKLISHPAETLAEVIIAITVLTLGTGSATILVNTSIHATASGENRLIAYNLAREGVEAIRNLRDTNWLRFPGNQEDCWDVYNVTDPDQCNTNKLGAPDPGQNLAVSPEFSDSPSLFTWNVNTSLTNPAAPLYTVDLNGADSLGDPVTLGGLFYTHDDTDPFGSPATPTPFSRQINIVKEPPGTEMVVTATVTWEENGQTLSAGFVDKLINY